MAAINKLKGTQRSDRGWYQIAWAFLKVTVEVNLCTVNVRSLIFLSVVLCTNLYTINVRSLIFLVRGGRLECSKSITRSPGHSASKLSQVSIIQAYTIHVRGVHRIGLDVHNPTIG
jgi:hypothetical protein